MKATRTNLLAGVILMLVGAVQLNKDNAVLGSLALVVGALLIGQYFWLKRSGDEA